MKTINFAFKFLIINFIFISLNLLTGICGSGGGSGEPQTPYKSHKTITEENIIQIKSISNRVRAAKLPRNLKSYYHDSIHGIGFIYIQNERELQYSEELDKIPEDFKFDNCGVNKVSFKNNKDRIILNGLMSNKERYILINKLPELTVDKEFRKQLVTAINKLYFLPRITNKVYLYLEGYSHNGDKEIIYLSDIAKFKILKVDRKHNRMFIEIEKFPDISPKKLLSTRPSYVELKENYTTILKLWVNFLNEEDEELYLTKIIHKNDNFRKGYFNRDLRSKIHFGEREYFIWDELKFGEFQENDVIELSYCDCDDNIWWAIPSVIEDIHYPHRVIFSK